MFVFTSSSTAFLCFSSTFSRGKFVNLACFIVLLQMKLNISSLGRYSYLSVLPDDNANIFAISPLRSCFNFSCLNLSSIVMISFYIHSKKLCLKVKDYLL